MAENTNILLRNDVIYSIYVRNHTAEGTFESIIGDLDRIKSLGTDIIWFMPIHPIGEKNKKGSLGCPYAIKDYRGVNSEYGTKADFEKLVDEIHKRGMKCIIDVVYNHTSPDSWLVENRPEFFYRKPDGNMGNKTGDWTDIVDLDYRVADLWDYQIETLKMWAEIVDGFRCDVASLIPLEFWLKARKEVAAVRKDCLWLAESVEVNFVKDNRRRGLVALSDSEAFQAFDICYDYDFKPFFDMYLSGKISLEHYLFMLDFQDNIYAANNVKLRCLENHDRARAKAIISDDAELLNWTAFMYFQKGTMLIYAGQETVNSKTPSLFDVDKVDWNTGSDISDYLKKLYAIKKNPLLATGEYILKAHEDLQIAEVRYTDGNKSVCGFFSLKARSGNVNVNIADGAYVNQIDGEKIEIKNGVLFLDGKAVIFEV